MNGTAYVMFEDVPLGRLNADDIRPQITSDMAIDAAVMAYREGDETSATEFIRELVKAMKPTSEDAAERMVREIMDVIRAG